METSTNKGLQLGDKCPNFDLPCVDGSVRGLRSYDPIKVLVVAFTCNHCPYVQAYEDRIMAIQREMASAGAQVVCINANETANFPEDSFEKMIERARSRWFNFHYLRDESQASAKAFGAECTPEFFVFDDKRVLRYRGRLDDNKDNPKAVTQTYLRDAITALLRGDAPATPSTSAIGCSIKWDSAKAH